jgi:hypothetical protein
VLDTLLPLLTAKLKMAAVAVAAVALSTSAVAVTTVSDEQPLEGATASSAAQDVQGALAVLEDNAVATPGAGADEPAEDLVEAPAEKTAPSDVVLPQCPADVKNHGAYVSSVARDKSALGRDHGARVSAAAKSDCGKGRGGGKK